MIGKPSWRIVPGELKVFKRCALLTLSVFLPASSFAQGVPILQRGNLDVSGFGLSTFQSSLGGVSVSGTSLAFGAAAFSVGAPSSNGGGGVRVAWAAARRIRIYGEWSYLGGSRNDFNEHHIVEGTPPTTQQVTLKASTSFQNAGGGVEWLFPILRTPKLVPYVQTGLGTINITGGASVSTIGRAPSPEDTFSSRIEDTRLVWGGGAGFRYYFTERAGLRFEINTLVGPQSNSGNTAAAEAVVPNGATHLARFVYGFFYQIR
jgi:hypothetical protein